MHPMSEILSRRDSSRSPTYYHQLRYGMAHRSCQNQSYMDLMKQFTVRKQSAPSAIANAAVAEVDTPIVNPMLRKLSKMSFMNRGENASRTGGNTKDYDSIDMIDLRN